MVSFADKPLLDITVEEWEQYLAGVPDDGGVRLKLCKKSSSVVGMTWAQALDVALCYGWIDGQVARFDENFTINAFTPRRKNSPWSMMNREHVARLVEEGRMRPAGWAEVERAKADGRWDVAYRQKGAVAPEDLRAALDASPEAAAFLATLTKVELFQIYFRLGSIKTPSIRATRVRDVVEKAARGEKHYGKRAAQQ